MLKKHKDAEHNIRNIATVHKEQREELTTIFQQMDAEIQECMESIQELNSLQESMKTSLEAERQHIRKQLEITIRKAKDNAQQLEQQLDSIEQPKIDNVEDEQNRLLRQVQEINTIKSLAQNTIDTSPIHEYVGQHALIAETVA